jgi:hypothetical protein
MSERTRSSHITGTPHEVNDLAEFHASKTQEAFREAIHEAANTDLSNASIQSINVVRLSARPEKRALSSLGIPAPSEMEPKHDRTRGTRTDTRRRDRYGILTNPYYPYKGDPLTRLITLLANIVKSLESHLLAALQPQAPIPGQPQVVIKTKKRGSDGREIEESEEGLAPRDQVRRRVESDE